MSSVTRTPLCTVKVCGRKHHARGWCEMHWKRWRNHGDPLFLLKPRAYKGEPCLVGDCLSLATKRNYCNTHYIRLRRHGDLNHKRPANGWLDRDGYRKVKQIGRPRPEHRVIMEGILGRALAQDEIVHHKNGDRQDNRPENLEVHHSHADHARHHWETTRRG